MDLDKINVNVMGMVNIMKKSILIKIALFICIFLSLLSHLSNYQGKETQGTSAKLVFPVLSDIHIGGRGAKYKLKRALVDCKRVCKNSDIIAVVGDFTDNGKVQEYRDFMSILKSKFSRDANQIITIGNHEYKDVTSNEKELRARFMEETSEKNIYYDKWVKGYHFIVLGSEGVGLKAEISKAQLDWLDEKLKENENSNRPIFVFIHQPIPKTVYGSDTWGDILNYKQLDEILKKFPQVVMFSGHSHYDINNVRTMYKNKYTMFNTASIYYIMGEDNEYKNYRLSEGLIVEVYEEKLIIRPRDFTSKRWIGDGYIINIKAQ